MGVNEENEVPQEEKLGERSRRVGMRHLLLGFLLILFLLFVTAWCSLPGR
jgi:hypothetical protein